jgi:hypothetical protein
MLALFFRGLALWLGYLGCSAMDYWDSLYFLEPRGLVRLRQGVTPTVLSDAFRTQLGSHFGKSSNEFVRFESYTFIQE